MNDHASTRSPDPAAIAAALVRWHAVHGRHDLPWQEHRTRYRVWVSEIMLQQTQVATVVPYYLRFMTRFPDVLALADAPLDEVLHLWTGLGYYARARNLHRAARMIRDEHEGVFPGEFAGVQDLPGIGRSTAGAILALADGKHHSILDGNVRRVLARCFAVEGDPAARAIDQRLWQLADACTPRADVQIYTQAIMDLGATICVRRRPLCLACPLQSDCIAWRTGRQHELPAPRVRRTIRRAREVVMLVAIRADGAVLLEKRPPQGIWGGLWCLPEFTSETAARSYAANQLTGLTIEMQALSPVPHAFTHFDLVITPMLARCTEAPCIMEADRLLWYNARDPARIGLPAPIVSILENLT